MSPRTEYILRLFVADASLLELYRTHVAAHNQAVSNDPFPNAGFDLFVPQAATVEPGNTVMLSHKVHAEMVRFAPGGMTVPSAFWLCPRSSINRTPLALANSQGVIDAGYRGELIAALRHVVYNKPACFLNRENRLVQICSPDLRPFTVEIVPTLESLSTTSRGNGGFGSTGATV